MVPVPAANQMMNQRQSQMANINQQIATQQQQQQQPVQQINQQPTVVVNQQQQQQPNFSNAMQQQQQANQQMGQQIVSMPIQNHRTVIGPAIPNGHTIQTATLTAHTPNGLVGTIGHGGRF